ncbi:MAG TPA: hypothetical protein VGS21_11235 [Acidimicrobiales bacterium]|nr:hypothetical protein [Acidimicrobiales bacterium]
MSRLPSHHIARRRLTDRCLGVDASVVVVEAGAGYGKSVLGAELAEVWGAVPVEVILEEGAVSAQLLVGRLRAAVARAGYLDAAAAMAKAGDDAAGSVDAMVAAIAGESCVVVIDDAHHAARDAAVLIDRIAASVAPPLRLVVLARRLPAGAERLRRAEAVSLSATDLALTDAEVLTLCRTGFGLDVTGDEAGMLEAATGGWTAAAVLAASRAKQSGKSLRDLTTLGTGGHGDASASVASILDELIVAFGDDRRRLGLIAPLPLLDGELVGEITGEPDFLDRAVALGLPLAPGEDGWSVLPGAVRDHLASLGKPGRAELAAAARHYERRGRLDLALQLLLGAGEEEEAAGLLDGMDVRAVDTIDALELLSAFDRLSPEVAARHKQGKFQVARACGIAALLAPRKRLLAELEEDTLDEDPALRRAVDAEKAVDSLNHGRASDGLDLGRRVLAAAGEGEQLTRARALIAVGYGLCLQRDAEGRLSESSLREAAREFDRASAIYRDLGYEAGASGVVAPRALWTELGIGRAEEALRVLEDGLAVSGVGPIRAGRLLYHRAQVLWELGRFDEADASLDEVERIGRRHDPLLVAFSFWGRVATASLRGDAAATVENVHAMESNRGEWWAAVGSEFLADAADCLDRVGEHALATDYLARAKAEPNAPERWLALAECGLLARHGDPELAEKKLSEVDRLGIFPKEYWRVTLLRAYAAWRRGDQAAAGLAARAVEEAARLGQPQVPLVREREVAESLLALAVETGSPAARALQARSMPVALAVLGVSS